VRLVAENLILSRGGRTIIDGLSLELAGGEALMLTGANGTGKTTLLRALAGFLAPTSGRIEISGEGDEREGGELVHYVAHLDGIKSHLTVAENLRFWAEFLGTRADGCAEDRLDAALDLFALSALSDIPAGYLSAGQKRRLGLSRLAAVKRPVWLLDEPTVSLDAGSVGRLVTAIDAHVKGGGIAVIATHVALGLERIREIRLGAAEAAA
jgi:heme exporter protein A